MKPTPKILGFPCSSVGKESACNAGDSGLIPGLGRSPGGGNGNPLQYSYLGNQMDRGAWWTIVHGIAKSKTRLKRLKPHPPRGAGRTMVLQRRLHFPSLHNETCKPGQIPPSCHFSPLFLTGDMLRNTASKNCP